MLSQKTKVQGRWRPRAVEKPARGVSRVQSRWSRQDQQVSGEALPLS